MLAAAFLLPLKRKRKRPGKTPSRFRRKCLNSFIPNEAISALPYRPQDGRLEVIVFYRAGAESVAAANREPIGTQGPQVSEFSRREVRVGQRVFGNEPRPLLHGVHSVARAGSWKRGRGCLDVRHPSPQSSKRHGGGRVRTRRRNDLDSATGHFSSAGEFVGRELFIHGFRKQTV